MKKAALIAFAFVGISTAGFASTLHQSIKSEFTDQPSACTFPDGTNPQNQPNIHCYSPSEFLKAYGLDQVHQLGLTGKGQTIILADSFGSPTMQADLDHFSDTFGLPHTTIQFIYPNGPYVNPLQTGDQLGWAEETTLDLEWAHAMAPDATLVNIITNVSETTGVAGFPELFSGIQMAFDQYPNAIVSMSFATGEATFTDADIAQYVRGSFHSLFEQATAKGMTLLAGAGDWGSVSINLDQTSMLAAPTSSYPASDPYITSVGGTSLQAGWRWNPQGTAADYWTCKQQKLNPCPSDFLAFEPADGVTESVWKEDWAIAATGGGVSTIFDAPSFQSGLGPQIVQLSNGHRANPDISLNAAINGGVEVYMSFVAPALGVTAPQWHQFGGTSCATPEMAGVVALAGQLASEELGRNVGIGYLNPRLYAMSSADFRDIVSQTVGVSNQVTLDSNQLYSDPNALVLDGPTRVTALPVPGYSTLPGYDLATGLGTPMGARFVRDLAKSRVEDEKIFLGLK